MPDQDPYADAAPAEAAAPEAPEKDTTPEQESKGDSQTAEIPKSALGGSEMKPGSKVQMEIVQVMEDSVLCKVANQEEEHEEAPPEAAPPPAAAPGGGGGNPLYQ